VCRYILNCNDTHSSILNIQLVETFRELLYSKYNQTKLFDSILFELNGVTPSGLVGYFALYSRIISPLRGWDNFTLIRCIGFEVCGRNIPEG
jgi:hypothetical protein